MRIEGIRWSYRVSEKIERKHRVSRSEVDELFDGNIGHLRKTSSGYAAYGRTEAGRYLAVFFRMTTDRWAKILTARDMERREVRLYRKATGK